MGSVFIQFEKNHCHIIQDGIQKTFSVCFYEKEALDHFLLKNPFLDDKNITVIISLPTEHIITHDFLLDKNVSDAEIMAFIAMKSLSTFGYPIERLSFDYCTENQNDHQKRISVVAAHRSLIDDIATTFRIHKIKIDRITASDNNQTVNLLPWREQKRKRHQKNIIFLLLFFSVSCLIGILLFNKYLLHATTRIDQKIIAINQAIQKITLSDVSVQNTAIKKIKERYENTIKTQKINLRLENILAVMTMLLPSTTRLTQFHITAEKIMLSGISNSFSDVAHYRESLQKGLSPKNIGLTDIHTDPANPTFTDFTLVLII